MEGVSAGSTYCTRISSTKIGNGLPLTFAIASTETPRPAVMKTPPMMRAPVEKKRSRSSCPFFGIRDSGSSDEGADGGCSKESPSSGERPAERSAASILSLRVPSRLADGAAPSFGAPAKSISDSCAAMAVGGALMLAVGGAADFFPEVVFLRLGFLDLGIITGASGARRTVNAPACLLGATSSAQLGTAVASSANAATRIFGVTSEV